MEGDPTQNPFAQSSKERDDGTLDDLCGKLQQLRHGHSLPPLPPELLLCVFDYFRLPVQDVTSTIPPPEFLVNRKTLYNLCLTSSVLNDLAKPLLYQTVIFFLESRDSEDHQSAIAYGGLRSLILLVRTLFWKDEYCEYVKNIICPASLKPRDWDSELEIIRDECR
ncbi:hypothetical protein F5Y00DRAFT_263435 [Daldinia vernicosa]|uniref:uncharacterized protein n=1 Tax=Daldinia vernicosa TaxID=114800 RepID=UPI0020084CB7|nr:uncharacterized protein F5Y00DRAFT_263435 [Daldinia vernicosa]KAI0847525.1 hypothetical protein F5Y00DRAFT_263435 [Daldinia vernicosa]